MRLAPVLVLALLAPLAAPVASSSHWGCVPASTQPTETVSAGGESVYLLVREQQVRHVWVYRESNGIPGLQEQGGCNHARDSLLFEACGSVSTRIPGTILCLVET